MSESTTPSPAIASPPKAAASPVASALLDLRGTPCPINFVRAKMKLAQITAGSLLEVWLDAGEPIEQVPDSLRMEGYPIEVIEAREGFFSLKVRRPVEM
jgi:TusA-related sulfurtransferase